MLMVKRVGGALSIQRRKGRVKSGGGLGHFLAWEVSRE